MRLKKQSIKFISKNSCCFFLLMCHSTELLSVIICIGIKVLIKTVNKKDIMSIDYSWMKC